MRILVTGGAGYIGSHTVKELLESGHRPIVFDNLKTGHREAVLSEDFCAGDLRDPQAIRACVEHYRPEAVIHFAASCCVGESVAAPAKYYQNNLVGALNLLEVMVEKGLEGIVLSSSCAVYGDPRELPLREDHGRAPVHPYGRSKYFIEELLGDYRRAYGIRSACLRYFNAAGADPQGRLGEDHDPETHLIPLVLRAALTGAAVKVFGADYPTPDGTCVRDYIHVQDLARAHVRAVEKLAGGWIGEPVNLGSGKGCSVREVIEAAGSVTRRPIRVTAAPRREGDVPCLVADIAKARSSLGWRPAADLAGILETSWNWMQRHPGGYRTSRISRGALLAASPT